MTTAEAMNLINKKATIQIDGLVFDVLCTDVRTVYGNTQALVTPANSHLNHGGFKWVSLDRLYFPDMNCVE